MTRYRYYTATTVDGFLADENDSLAWLFKQDTGDAIDTDSFITQAGAQVMGVTTYLWVLEHEPDWLPQLPTFVFTHRDLQPANEHVVFVSGQPADHRSAIEGAAGEKDVWMMGGGDLAAAFAAAGMLDEVELSIAPVMLGSGRRLFGGAVDLSLRSFSRAGDFLTATFDVVAPLGTR